MKTLIIESDRSFAQDIELWLSGCGCRVDIAPNGDTALQMIDRDEYDRILLDNIGLYQHLQAQGCQSHILLLIPPGEEWQKAIAINAGIKDYLVQPFDGEELRARWQSWSAEEVETSEDVADRIWSAVERARAEAALQERETQLAAKLAHTQQLQRLSSQLIPENNVQSLYQQILDASIAIMEADMGTIQMLDPERNELQLLAHNGLDPASAIFWQWVGSTARSACSKALKRRDRVIIPDVEADNSLAGTDDLKAFRASGIRAAQSTPLLARDGSVVGAISTQWRSPHQPGEWELNLLEVLARQVSDLIERTRTQQQVESELRNTQLLHALATQVVTEDGAFYQEILTAAIALTAADAGTVQMLERTDGELVILAHQGFEPQMMAHFHHITASCQTSCGRALATGDRAFVDFDVPASEDPDGSLKMHVEAGYLSAQSTPLVSRAGKLIGMVSTHWRQHHRPSDRQLHFLDLLARQAADAIEQRQIAAALQEREELLRSMTQAGAWTWEMATGKLTWSPEVYRLHGIDPAREQIDYDRWFNNYLHPEDRPKVSAYLEQVVKQRPSEFQLEHRILHSQGIRCLLSIAHPLWSDRGELVRMSGIIVDISERKLAEIALQQSEAKFRHFAQNSHAAIWIAQPNTLEALYISPAYETIWGRSC